jgi:hypothetical protein
VVFQAIEMRRPQPAVGGEPLVELRERLGSDAVQATLRVGARLDEPCVLEDSEVLGDSRLTEADAVDQLADRPFAVAEQVEELKPPWLGQNLERSRLRHPRSITT